MKYVKLETSDGTARWINLEQVSRVTLAQDPGKDSPLLVITFEDASAEARVQVRGSNPADLKVIRQFTKLLDKLAGPKR
jgi:hypothetical protein